MTGNSKAKLNEIFQFHCVRNMNVFVNNSRVALAYSKLEIEFQLLTKGFASSEAGSSQLRGFDVGAGSGEIIEVYFYVI